MNISLSARCLSSPDQNPRTRCKVANLHTMFMQAVKAMPWKQLQSWAISAAPISQNSQSCNPVSSPQLSLTSSMALLTSWRSLSSAGYLMHTCASGLPALAAGMTCQTCACLSRSGGCIARCRLLRLTLSSVAVLRITFVRSRPYQSAIAIVNSHESLQQDVLTTSTGLRWSAVRIIL